MKKILIILPLFTALAFAGSASANNSEKNYNGASNYNYNHSDMTFRSLGVHSDRKGLIGDGSSTASKFYRMGLRAYEKNDLKEAERTFRAALLANGLNAESLSYLVKIAEANGEMEKAREYALQHKQLTSGPAHRDPDARLFSRVRATN